MNKKLTIIIGLQAFLIIVLFWVLVFYGKDEYDAYNQAQEEEVATPNRVSQNQGATVVTLSQEAQSQSDIKTEKITSGKHQNTLAALGQVLNIDTLIELRTRYLNAKANASIARASLTNSQQDFQRMQALNKDDKNVSDHAVLVAQAAFKADQAKVQAAETEANNLRDTMRQTWGSTLADEASKENVSPNLQALLQHREVLVLITLPLDNGTPKAGESISVTPTGSNNKAITANYLAAAPLTDATIQGKTYYYRASADVLRAGMRVNVQLKDSSQSEKAVTGFVVPAKAVVWYGGKAWVYKKQDKTQFVRLPISVDSPSNGGWFNQSKQLNSGDELVVNGAQLLLSEEFKYQIKNENED
jgi:membrane fusion protein, multidrug efflux system